MMLQRIKDFIQSLKPANTPPELLEDGAIRPIQERVLHTTYLIASVLTILIVILFISAAYIFFKTGISAIGFAALFSFILFTTILFGSKAGWRAFLLSSITLALLAFGFANGIISAPVNTSLFDVTLSRNWLQNGLPSMALIGISAVAVLTLLNELNINATS